LALLFLGKKDHIEKILLSIQKGSSAIDSHREIVHHINKRMLALNAIIKINTNRHLLGQG
jgi:hypothetical protein